jgi:AcrR family transcriptional regulator
MTEMPRVAREEGETDGRRRRSLANRRRIVAAMLALVREGDLMPSADTVATRAGVGRRTVFRLFSDMESIYREMHESVRAEVEPIRAIPLTGNSLAERFASLARRRARLFEAILPLEEAAALVRHRSPMLTAQHASTEAELSALVRAEMPQWVKDDPPLAEALDLLLSLDSWRRLRRQRGLDPEATLATIDRMIASLLGTAD